MSTQDEVAASLVKDYGISVFAVRGENHDTLFTQHIQKVLEFRPHITMDDGSRSSFPLCMGHLRELLSEIKGAGT